MKKICGIYKITNIITGEFYIGSSVNIYTRWRKHRAPYTHKVCPNSKMYQDMDELGIESFQFEILEEVSAEELKVKEDEYIKELNPTYNIRSAVLDVDGFTAHRKAYLKTYMQSEKEKARRKAYYNRTCNYNGEVLTLCALTQRFKKQEIPHPSIEARKYLVE